uniref:Uncharacterized protein n=1 Tax=Arundo donax TaxID=35708 RepID=A0A0A9H0M7_ARUDO
MHFSHNDTADSHHKILLFSCLFLLG